MMVGGYIGGLIMNKKSNYKTNMKFNKTLITLCCSGLGWVLANPALADDPKTEGKRALVAAVEGVEFAVSGVAEVELGFSKTDSGTQGVDDTDSSDITLATVELHFDAQVTDMVSAHISMLYEEDDTPLEIDEGIITIGDVENGFYFSGGQMYVPFGTFETNLISDPLTLDLGETRESALMIGFNNNGFHGAAYIFNGDTIETDTFDDGDDTIENGGLRIGYVNDMVDVGVDYITSIGDADSFQDVLAESQDSYVAGVAAHVMLNLGDFNIILERVQALDNFKISDFAEEPAKEPEPVANHVEAAFTFAEEHTIAASYQFTDDSAGFLPEKRWLLGYSTTIFESASLAVEFSHEEDYSFNDGGTEDETDTVTVQLAVEF